MRPISRATGTIASFTALAALAGPITVSASAALPVPPLPQPVQQTLPPLPPSVPQAVQQLLGLAPNSPIPASVSAPIVTLLDQAASTPGVPSQVADALRQLAAALSSPNPPNTAQVAADLRSIALTPGLPSQVSALLNSLADAFDGGSGANGSGSNGAGSGANGSGSNGAGAPGSNGSGSNGTNGMNGSGSIAGFAAVNPFGPRFKPNGVTASGLHDSRAVRSSGAVIKSVRYSAKSHRVYVVVACRATTTPCNTAVAVYQGRRQAARPIAKTIVQRRQAAFTMRVSTRAARTLAKRGGVLRAVAVSNTPYGQAHSAKSIHVRRGRR